MPSDPHVSITLDATQALQKLQPVIDWLDGLHVATEDQTEHEETEPGMWCPHGKHVMVPDPADTRDYPSFIFADPWPCQEGCTAEQITADGLAADEQYEADRWAEYYDTCREGLSSVPGLRWQLTPAQAANAEYSMGAVGNQSGSAPEMCSLLVDHPGQCKP